MLLSFVKMSAINLVDTSSHANESLQNVIDLHSVMGIRLVSHPEIRLKAMKVLPGLVI